MACPRGCLAREQMGLGDRFRVGGVPGEPQPGPHSHRGHGVEAQGVGSRSPSCPAWGAACSQSTQSALSSVARLGLSAQDAWSWLLLPCGLVSSWTLGTCCQCWSSCSPPLAAVRPIFLSCEEAGLCCLSYSVWVGVVGCGPWWQVSARLLSHRGCIWGYLLFQGPRYTPWDQPFASDC